MNARFAKLAGAAVAGALFLGAPVSATFFAPTAFAADWDFGDDDGDGASNRSESYYGTDPQNEFDYTYTD